MAKSIEEELNQRTIKLTVKSPQKLVQKAHKQQH